MRASRRAEGGVRIAIAMAIADHPASDVHTLACITPSK